MRAMVIWFLCSLIAIEKTYIVSMYALCDVQCERQPFLVPRYSIKIIITTSFYCRFFISVSLSLSLSFFHSSFRCTRRVLCTRVNGTRRDSVHISFTAFYKMTRFYLTPLCKSVCSKRHGKWKEFKSLYNSHVFFFYSLFQSNSMHFALFSFSSGCSSWKLLLKRRAKGGLQIGSGSRKKISFRDKRCNILSIQSQFNLANWFSM